MIIIARETKDPEAGMFEEGIKVGGGEALLYDSSLDLRISRSYISDPDDKAVIYGERHKVEVRKTKIGKKEKKIPKAYFHTSNGARSPVGFDRSRDVLELGKEWGIVEQKGASYVYDGNRLGVGELRALDTLYTNQELLMEIEMKCRNAAQESWSTDTNREDANT
jgi:recombination protein RecA